MNTDKKQPYSIAKPFLKWAGGKTQLIPVIEKALPSNLLNKKFTYIEPFVGGGSILFWMLEQFPNIEQAVINDVNSDLTNTYSVIKTSVQDLIPILKNWEVRYHKFSDSDEKRKDYFKNKKELFNTRSSDNVTQAALFIFLNRTCFNGLYRVNRSNLFNVPIGSYKTPLICDEENLLRVNQVLKKVEILCGDYTETKQYAGKNSFFYFDPPYKPLSETSSFNSYAKDSFNDDEQIRLKKFCDELDKKGTAWMLSNSDVKGKDPSNEFFDELYLSYEISRVKARRNINANPEKRGELNELLITNYSHEQALQTA